MAAKAPSPRGRKPRENHYIFELGVRGRKTGLTVPDSGIRDEHGLEPMDDLFSSPEKSKPKPNRPGKIINARISNATLSSEEDMDMGQSTIPEPNAVLTARKKASVRMPPPKSKSPIKTYLQSPPKRHPSLGPASSPTRGSIVTQKRASVQPSVARRLDFSVDDQDRNSEKAAAKSPPGKVAGSQKSSTQSFTASLVNGTRFSPINKAMPSHDQEKQRSRMEPLEAEDDDKSEDDEAFYPIMDGNSGNVSDEPIYEEDMVRDSTPVADPESPLPSTKKKAKTAPKAPAKAPVKAPVKALVKEPVKASMKEATAKPLKRKAESQPAGKPARKRAKDVRKEAQEAPAEEDERPAKRSRGRPKVVEAKPVEKVKKRLSKRGAKSSSPARVSSPAEIHRGPPRPRNNQGLFILRREMPDEVVHTKSGRSVVKPVAYWKNETIVYGDDEEADGDGSFFHPTIKEVIRHDHLEPPQRRAPRRKGVSSRKAGATTSTGQEEEEADPSLVEPWEKSPGRVYGAVRQWNPADPIGEESGEKEDELALSAAAIITRDIGSTFQFAKTLTLPFFGSGMVDLPPGAFKKPKNTRRMQMVFLVFSGRVAVTVNENSFRIGKGGLFQVPRGNFYSIENDYEQPARIFFAQGCEVVEEIEEDLEEGGAETG